MKNTIRCIAILATLVVAGCAKESVVGEWKGKPTTETPGNPTVTLNLKEDKTFALTAEASSGATKLTIAQSGTYAVAEKEKQITFTAKSVSLNGMNMPVPPAQAVKAVPYVLEDGKLSITQDGNELLLARVKK